ncbi:MAG: hypothetical protein ABGY41_14410 [Candidatus Poribacteria bacterium]
MDFRERCKCGFDEFARVLAALVRFLPHDGRRDIPEQFGDIRDGSPQQPPQQLGRERQGDPRDPTFQALRRPQLAQHAIRL